MKTIKRVSLFILCALSMFNMQAMHNDPTQPDEKAEAAQLSEEDQEWQDFVQSFKKLIPTLPATVVQSFVAGLAFSEGREWGMKGVKNLMKRACQNTANATVNAGSYIGSHVYNASSCAMDYVRNGTLLTQVGNLIGSYGDPESAESLYAAMQTVNATCKGEGIVLTNAEWLQAHSDIATGAKVAAVVAAAAVTYWAVKRLVKKYKKS